MKKNTNHKTILLYVTILLLAFALGLGATLAVAESTLKPRTQSHTLPLPSYEQPVQNFAPANPNPIRTIKA